MNQGDCYDLRKVEDEDEFVETKQALKVNDMTWDGMAWDGMGR